MQESLYFIHQMNQKWVFPNAPVDPHPSLHEAADQLIPKLYGSPLEVWRVGQAPIGHTMDATEKVIP
jgi:hypothetical protein